MVQHLTRYVLESELIDRTLARLAADTGIKATVVAREVHLGLPGSADAHVRLERNGHQAAGYLVECKGAIDRVVQVNQVKQQLDYAIKAHGGTPRLRGLLIAPYVTATLAGHCRVLGLDFIDAAGNAYLDAPGFYVNIAGQKASDLALPTNVMRGSGNPSAMRMIFGLLLNPGLVGASHREISAKTGIALGAVGTVFKDLARRGFVTESEARHPRRLLEPGRLLDEWAAGYPGILRPKLLLRRFRPLNPLWWQAENLEQTGALWGGEVAVTRLTKYLRPMTQTLYVEPSEAEACLKRLVSKYRMQPDPAGSVELLSAFWDVETTNAQRLSLSAIVPPILIYADLMASLEPRNLEAAIMIRQKFIDNVFHS